MKREFRVLKETIGSKVLFYPQYRVPPLSVDWFVGLLLGGCNGWRYWIEKWTYIGEYCDAGIPVSFVTQAEAEAFVQEKRNQDHPHREVVA